MPFFVIRNPIFILVNEKSDDYPCLFESFQKSFREESSVAVKTRNTSGGDCLTKTINKRSLYSISTKKRMESIFQFCHRSSMRPRLIQTA